MDGSIGAASRHPMLMERARYRHWSSEQVRWSDTDLVGHVNNLSFGAYCETGRCMFLRRFVEKDSQERALMLPAQLILNFISEVHWPDRVDIGTATLSIGNTSCRIAQGLFVGERCVGTSEVTNVLIDEQTRKPMPLSGVLLDYLMAYRLQD